MFTLTCQDRHGVMLIDPQGRTRKKLKPLHICPTLRAQMHGNPPLVVKVREATKKGYAVAKHGDSINLEQPNSETRRGRVGRGKANTLTTSPNQGVLSGMRIRKLIPRECFRLQAWADECYNRAARVNSDNQLYRQAGNGVTVTVIQKIGERL